MTETIEWRVRPVLRFHVTRYYEESSDSCDSIGSTEHGEFENESVAHEVAYALCKAEHDRLGWPVDDDRIKYPRPPEERGWRYDIGSTGNGLKSAKSKKLPEKA